MLNKYGVHDGVLFVERIMAVQMFNRELSTFSLVETRHFVLFRGRHSDIFETWFLSFTQDMHAGRKDGTFASQKPGDYSSQFRIHQFYKFSFT